MSIDINWADLDTDMARSVETYLTGFLNAHASDVGGVCENIRLSNLQWGSSPPQLTVLDILDPTIDNQHGSADHHVQVHVHAKYTGDLAFHLTLDLCVGDECAIKLPVAMHVQQVHFDAVVLVAWANSAVWFSLLECMDGGSGSTKIVQVLQINTSVGDSNHHVLHNVSKIEKFLVDAIHTLLETECVWPNCYSISILR